MSDVKKRINDLIGEFTRKVELAIAQTAAARLLKAFKPVVDAKRASGAKSGRRKGPIQLCPVPGCKERAAPVFGMVCSKHKDLPKTKIKVYRERRRKRTQARG